MTKTIKNHISDAISYRERLFYILLVAIVGLGIAYAGLVHATVQNVISREALLKQNRNQSGEIGLLEAHYFSLKNSVTLAVAKDLGYTELQPTYILEKNQGVARSTSNEI